MQKPVHQAATHVAAILHIDDRTIIIVSDTHAENETWGFPRTRIAEGEEIAAAAVRVAFMTTGIRIKKNRFGMPLCQRIIRGDVCIAVRANLQAAEYYALNGSSACGRFQILAVEKQDLPDFVPMRAERALMSP